MTGPDVPAAATTPRRPWLALLAGFFAPPLGHVYAGAPLRGVVVMTLSMAAALPVWMLTLRAQSSVALAILVVLLVALAVAVPTDAYGVARRAGQGYVLRPYNRWFVYLALVLVWMLSEDYLRAGARRWVQAYKVPSAAMDPTLLVGDHFLADKAIYRDRGPERFDVIVFDWPKDPTKGFVKRVVGLPGETIEVKDGRVWIDGAALDEPYARYVKQDRATPAQGDTAAPLVIPADSYFVMGDNRDQSYDSRFWGPVGTEWIRGRAEVIYFSRGGRISDVRWRRIGERIR
jgi:signal peptidase I